MIVLADRVVMSLVIRLDLEVLQLFFRGSLKVVMLVDYGSLDVAAVSRSKDGLEPFSHMEKTFQYPSHCSHLLPGKKVKRFSRHWWSQCPYFTPAPLKKARPSMA
jgi:hypothetical protein